MEERVTRVSLPKVSAVTQRKLLIMGAADSMDTVADGFSGNPMFRSHRLLFPLHILKAGNCAVEQSRESP